MSVVKQFDSYRSDVGDDRDSSGSSASKTAELLLAAVQAERTKLVAAKSDQLAAQFDGMPPIDPLPVFRVNAVDEARYKKDLESEKNRLHGDIDKTKYSLKEQEHIKQLQDAILTPAKLSGRDLKVDIGQLSKALQALFDDLPPEKNDVNFSKVFDALNETLSKKGLKVVGFHEFLGHTRYLPRRDSLTISYRDRKNGDTVWLDIPFTSTGTGPKFLGKKVLEPRAFWSNESKGMLSQTIAVDEALADLQSRIVKPPKVDSATRRP